jgi:hypothetical protein
MIPSQLRLARLVVVLAASSPRHANPSGLKTPVHLGDLSAGR